MEHVTRKFAITMFHWSEGVLEGSGAVRALRLIQEIPALGANFENNAVGAKKLDNLVCGFRRDISSKARGAHDMEAYLSRPLLKVLKKQQLHEPAQAEEQQAEPAVAPVIDSEQHDGQQAEPAVAP
eukprot:3937873-Rhodomonas_salina.1